MRFLFVCCLLGTVAAQAQFVESNGFVIFEAENYSENDSKEWPRDWVKMTADQRRKVEPDLDGSHHESASDGAYMEVLPDVMQRHGDHSNIKTSMALTGEASPVLRYKVKFETAGRYYAWVRLYHNGTEENSIHLGLDGAWPRSGSKLEACVYRDPPKNGKTWTQGPAPDAWVWTSNQRIPHKGCAGYNSVWLDVETPGEHVVEISMREDGAEVDKVILTMDENFRPSGLGPEETR